MDNIVNMLSDREYINIKEAWLKFVKTGEVDYGIVRPMIAKSWLRSKNYGVSPFDDINKPTEFDIGDRLKKSSHLIMVAYPIIKTLYSMMRGTGFRVNLADEDGFLIISEGDEDVIERTNYLNAHIGVCRKEEVVGTCAVALALVEKKPVYISYYEHYNVNLHEWACSSAPIRNPEGKVVGVFNVASHRSSVHHHTLGMVMGIAKAIELALDKSITIEKLNNYQEIIQMILDKSYEGIVVYNEYGYLCQSNKKGEEILKALSEKDDISSLKNLGFIKDDNKRSREISEREVSCVLNDKRKYYYISISNNYSKRIGRQYTFVLLRDRDNLQRLTNKIMTSGAFYTFDDIIGNNPKILRAIKEGHYASGSDLPVLLIGETGTGKEMMAHAIHNNSSRAEGPFVAINCGAIPASLIESELFGYEPGSFTDASKGGKPGKLEMANGGTIFLDELDSMPLEMQTKLLRVLQTKEVTRIGGTVPISINIRVISASKKNLREEVKKGSFRDDFYYRIHALTIKLPPLRERREDIPILCKYFIERLNSKKSEKKIIDISRDVYDVFMIYDWPGNVRELETCIERAYIFEEGNVIKLESLPEYLIENVQHNTNGKSNFSILESNERNLIEQLLKRFHGNVSKTAKELGIGRDTLYRKFKKFNINWRSL